MSRKMPESLACSPEIEPFAIRVPGASLVVAGQQLTVSDQFRGRGMEGIGQSDRKAS
jgi:hypothetical protein